MTDLIQRLAEIREQAGYDALPDPSKIQGFEQGEPPPPEFPVRPPVDLSQVPDGPPEGDFDDEVFQDESPLIPRGSENLENSRQRIEPAQLDLPKPDLAVAAFGEKCVGSFEGDEVELSPSERDAVRAVVIKALNRRDEERVASRNALLPKRRRAKRSVERKARAKDGTSEGLQPTLEPPALPQVPKRRGRPPKQRLDGGTR